MAYSYYNQHLYYDPEPQRQPVQEITEINMRAVDELPVYDVTHLLFGNAEDFFNAVELTRNRRR